MVEIFDRNLALEDIPFLLTFEKDALFPPETQDMTLIATVSFAPTHDQGLLSLKDMESRMLMAEILASLNKGADVVFFKDKNEMTQLAVWITDIFQSPPKMCVVYLIHFWPPD